MLEIKPLPKSVQISLRSGQNIKNYAACITQLIYNSLDAKATSVAIRINLLSHKIQIIDNGNGITKTNLKLAGEAYMTNKYYSIKDEQKNKCCYGYRGETLFSIRQMCYELVITSKALGSKNAYTKTFKESRSSEIEKIERSSVGTTVTIENFLHKNPVRQNYLENETVLTEIKNKLEKIVLIHPNTSFSLRNDGNGEIIFQIPKTKYVVKTFEYLYGTEFSKSLRKVYYKGNNISVGGLMGVEASVQTKIQEIFVNKRIVKKNKLHKFVNSILTKALKAPFHDKDKEIWKREKNPIFILSITCSTLDIEIIDYTESVIEFKNYDLIVSSVKMAIEEILLKENLLPRCEESSQKNLEALEVPKYDVTARPNVIQSKKVTRNFNGSGSNDKKSKLNLRKLNIKKERKFYFGTKFGGRKSVVGSVKKGKTKGRKLVGKKGLERDLERNSERNLERNSKQNLERNLEQNLERNLEQNFPGRNFKRNLEQNLPGRGLGQNFLGSNLEENFPGRNLERKLEQNLPGRNLEQNLPGRDVEHNFAGRNLEQNFLERGREQNFPGRNLEQNLPGRDLEQNFPGRGREQNFPRRDLEQNFAGRSLYCNFPGRNLKQNLLEKDLEQNFPGRGREQNLPGRNWEQNFSEWDSKGKFLDKNSKQNSLGQNLKQDFPQWNSKRNFWEENLKQNSYEQNFLDDFPLKENLVTTAKEKIDSVPAGIQIDSIPADTQINQKLPTQESNLGKNLLLDVFLKSTAVYENKNDLMTVNTVKTNLKSILKPSTIYSENSNPKIIPEGNQNVVSENTFPGHKENFKTININDKKFDNIGFDNFKVPKKPSRPLKSSQNFVDTRVLDLNTVSSSVIGKKIIMDAFLKSTVIYKKDFDMNSLFPTPRTQKLSVVSKKSVSIFDNTMIEKECKSISIQNYEGIPIHSNAENRPHPVEREKNLAYVQENGNYLWKRNLNRVLNENAQNYLRNQNDPQKISENQNLDQNRDPKDFNGNYTHRGPVRHKPPFPVEQEKISAYVQTNQNVPKNIFRNENPIHPNRAPQIQNCYENNFPKYPTGHRPLNPIEKEEFLNSWYQNNPGVFKKVENPKRFKNGSVALKRAQRAQHIQKAIIQRGKYNQRVRSTQRVQKRLENGSRILKSAQRAKNIQLAQIIQRFPNNFKVPKNDPHIVQNESHIAQYGPFIAQNGPKATNKNPKISKIGPKNSGNFYDFFKDNLHEKGPTHFNLETNPVNKNFFQMSGFSNLKNIGAPEPQYYYPFCQRETNLNYFENSTDNFLGQNGSKASYIDQQSFYQGYRNTSFKKGHQKFNFNPKIGSVYRRKDFRPNFFENIEFDRKRKKFFNFTPYLNRKNKHFILPTSESTFSHRSIVLFKKKSHRCCTKLNQNLKKLIQSNFEKLKNQNLVRKRPNLISVEQENNLRSKPFPTGQKRNKRLRYFPVEQENNLRPKLVPKRRDFENENQYGCQNKGNPLKDNFLPNTWQSHQNRNFLFNNPKTISNDKENPNLGPQPFPVQQENHLVSPKYMAIEPDLIFEPKFCSTQKISKQNVKKPREYIKGVKRDIPNPVIQNPPNDLKLDKKLPKRASKNFDFEPRGHKKAAKRDILDTKNQIGPPNFLELDKKLSKRGLDENINFDFEPRGVKNDQIGVPKNQKCPKNPQNDENQDQNNLNRALRNTNFDFELGGIKNDQMKVLKNQKRPENPQNGENQDQNNLKRGPTNNVQNFLFNPKIGPTETKPLDPNYLKKPYEFSITFSSLNTSKLLSRNDQLNFFGADKNQNSFETSKYFLQNDLILIFDKTPSETVPNELQLDLNSSKNGSFDPKGIQHLEKGPIGSKSSSESILLITLDDTTPKNELIFNQKNSVFDSSHSAKENIETQIEISHFQPKNPEKNNFSLEPKSLNKKIGSQNLVRSKKSIEKIVGPQNNDFETNSNLSGALGALTFFYRTSNEKIGSHNQNYKHPRASGTSKSNVFTQNMLGESRTYDFDLNKAPGISKSNVPIQNMLQKHQNHDFEQNRVLGTSEPNVPTQNMLEKSQKHNFEQNRAQETKSNIPMKNILGVLQNHDSEQNGALGTSETYHNSKKMLKNRSAIGSQNLVRSEKNNVPTQNKPQNHDSEQNRAPETSKTYPSSTNLHKSCSSFDVNNFLEVVYSNEENTKANVNEGKIPQNDKSKNKSQSKKNKFSLHVHNLELREIDTNTKNYETENSEDKYEANVNEEWIEKKNTQGKDVLVNCRTGMSIFQKPIDNTFSITSRYANMPKGMSPLIFATSKPSQELTPISKNILYETMAKCGNDDVRTVKWLKYFKDKDAVSFFNNLYENMNYYESDVPSLTKNVTKLSVEYKFTKEMFENLTVLNQLDKKFIVATYNDENERKILVLFDQHAVDERIRLEKLLKHYKDGSNNSYKKVSCKNNFRIRLNNTELQMLRNSAVQKQFESWGIFYKKENQNSVLITHIPMFLQLKDDSYKSNLEESYIMQLLNYVIKEQDQILKTTGKINPILPLSLLNIIKYESCRGAIKFGDKLPLEKCVELIKNLSKCDLPFECAHGRPTLTIITNLSDIVIKEQDSKINLKKIKLHESLK